MGWVAGPRLVAATAEAGGLDVLDPAIRRLFSRRAKVHILGPTRLYSFPAAQLAAI